jgi:hypothetical protein
MIGGAIAISRAEAPASERASWKRAMTRECDRYGLDPARVEAAVLGKDPLAEATASRPWWDIAIIVAALGVFVWLAAGSEAASLNMNLFWSAALVAATLAVLVAGATALWRRTRFS